MKSLPESIIKRQKKRWNSRAFTIIELLIVITIIGIITALVAPQTCSVKVKIGVNNSQPQDTWNPKEWTPDEERK